MQAKDILTATHKLEESGMSRSQSEAIADTIIAAVAPIKADLKSLKEQMATKADLASLKEHMATKADLESLKEQMATKADLAAMNAKIESTKVWLLGGLLVIALSIVTVA